MTATPYYIDFKSLRFAYNEVKNFLEAESFEAISSLNTRIYNDLGCSGDDAWDLLTRFVKKYNLDAQEFDFSEHFLSEGELYGSDVVLLKILLLPIIIIDLVLKLLRRTKKSIVPNIYRKTSDLTFGDMLAWYITGKYTVRKDIHFVVKYSA